MMKNGLTDKLTDKSAFGSHPIGQANRVGEFRANLFHSFCGIGSRRHLYFLGSREIFALRATNKH